MAYKKNAKRGIEEPRINDEITGCDLVRLVSKTEDGESKSEVVKLYVAKKRAAEMGKDLIEVNRKTTPPIVRIEEYSKYMYELKKALKAKNKPASTLKEVQLSTNISSHDLGIKANKARKFIEGGDKVKVVLTMRGRELSRRDESKRSLYEFIDTLSDISVPEAMPRDEGNKCTVILKRK